MAAKLKKVGDAWWVIVHHKGQRRRRSYGDDRETAERVAREINRRVRDGGFGLPVQSTTLTLQQMVERYLAEDTGHLAETTRGDLDGYFREGGALRDILPMRIDEITPAVLREWWGREIAQKNQKLPR